MPLSKKRHCDLATIVTLDGKNNPERKTDLPWTGEERENGKLAENCVAECFHMVWSTGIDQSIKSELSNLIKIKRDLGLWIAGISLVDSYGKYLNLICQYF